MQPLLSVGIPTWNRADYLREAIRSISIQADRDGLADQIEIVVCDNASTDQTRQTVEEIAAVSRVPIRYHLNETNIGGLKNVLKTLELSRGQWWMFYGDDDRMVDGSLARLCECFRQHPDAAAFLFELSPAVEKWALADVGNLSIEQAARRYFYYLGFAGVFAADGELARKALREQGFDAFSTCWPQTQIVFSVMAAKGGAAPFVTAPIASSTSPFHGDNTRYTAYYIWETGMFALYRTALNLRPIAGEPFFKAACDHLFAPHRLIDFLSNMARHVTLVDLPEEVASVRTATRKSLRRATPRSAFALWSMFLIVWIPRPIMFAGVWLGGALRGAFPGLKRFRELRDKRRESLRIRREAISKARSYKPGDL